jgi:hypothetical protein
LQDSYSSHAGLLHTSKTPFAIILTKLASELQEARNTLDAFLKGFGLSSSVGEFAKQFMDEVKSENPPNIS